MPNQEMIDALIASYRELNHKIRGANIGDEVTVQELEKGHDSISGILYQMRNRELNASQAIKRMVQGLDSPQSDDEATVLTEQQVASGIRPHILLSQFGTAREASLSVLRELPDEEWDKEYQTPRGRMTLRQYVQSLIDRDREQIRRIDEKLKARV